MVRGTIFSDERAERRAGCHNRLPRCQPSQHKVSARALRVRSALRGVSAVLETLRGSVSGANARSAGMVGR